MTSLGQTNNIHPSVSLLMAELLRFNILAIVSAMMHLRLQLFAKEKTFPVHYSRDSQISRDYLLHYDLE